MNFQNYTRFIFVLLFASILFSSNTILAQGCNYSKLTLDNVTSLTNGQYQIDLTFCAGGGSEYGHCGGMDDTYDFGFILYGNSSTFVTVPDSLTSPQNGASYYPFLWNTDTLVYYGNYAQPWVCNIGCGPIGAYCKSFSMITSALPDSIFCLAMEGGGVAPFGCLDADMVVYPTNPTPNDPCDIFDMQADAGDDLNVQIGGLPGDECTLIDLIYSGGGTTPYSYTWSNGETTQDINVCPSVTTTYAVTITDAVGCTTTDDVTVEVEDVRCGRRNNRVLMCTPNGVTKCISQNKVSAKLNQGWTIGACSSNNYVIDNNTLTFNWATEKSPIRVSSNNLNSFTKLEILAEENGNFTVQLFDMSGKLVQNIYNGIMGFEEYKSFQIKSDDLPSGLYILNVKTDFGVNESFKMLR